jgi:tetrahydromethanopterin S-methyltransferase subunit E
MGSDLFVEFIKTGDGTGVNADFTMLTVILIDHNLKAHPLTSSPNFDIFWGLIFRRRIGSVLSDLFFGTERIVYPHLSMELFYSWSRSLSTKFYTIADKHLQK